MTGLSYTASRKELGLQPQLGDAPHTVLKPDPRMEDLAGFLEYLQHIDKTLDTGQSRDPSINLEFGQWSLMFGLVQEYIAQLDTPKNISGAINELRDRFADRAGQPWLESDRRDLGARLGELMKTGQLLEISKRLGAGEKLADIGARPSAKGDESPYAVIGEFAKRFRVNIDPVRSEEDLRDRTAAYMDAHRSLRNYKEAAMLGQSVLAEEIHAGVMSLDEKATRRLFQEAVQEQKADLATAQMRPLLMPAREQGALQANVFERWTQKLIDEALAPEHFDESALPAYKRKAWRSYRDCFDPRRELLTVRDSTVDDISDFGAIELPKYLVSGWVGGQVGGVAMGLFRRQLAKELATRAGMAEYLGSSEAGAALARSGINAAGMAPVLAASGTAMAATYNALDGKFLFAQPDWLEQVGWSMAAAGFMGMASRAGRALIGKQVTQLETASVGGQRVWIESGQAELRTRLGSYIGQISNPNLRAVAETLLVKGAVEPAALLLLQAVQHGAYGGSIDQFLENLGPQVIKNYMTLGAFGLAYRDWHKLATGPYRGSSYSDETPNGSPHKQIGLQTSPRTRTLLLPQLQAFGYALATETGATGSGIGGRSSSAIPMLMTMEEASAAAKAGGGESTGATMIGMGQADPVRMPIGRPDQRLQLKVSQQAGDRQLSLNIRQAGDAIILNISSQPQIISGLLDVLRATPNYRQSAAVEALSKWWVANQQNYLGDKSNSQGRNQFPDYSVRWLDEGRNICEIKFDSGPNGIFGVRSGRRTKERQVALRQPQPLNIQLQRVVGEATVPPALYGVLERLDALHRNGNSQIEAAAPAGPEVQQQSQTTPTVEDLRAQDPRSAPVLHQPSGRLSVAIPGSSPGTMVQVDVDPQDAARLLAALSPSDNPVITRQEAATANRLIYEAWNTSFADAKSNLRVDLRSSLSGMSIVFVDQREATNLLRIDLPWGSSTPFAEQFHDATASANNTRITSSSLYDTVFDHLWDLDNARQNPGGEILPGPPQNLANPEAWALAMQEGPFSSMGWTIPGNGERVNITNQGGNVLRIETTISGPGQDGHVRDLFLPGHPNANGLSLEKQYMATARSPVDNSLLRVLRAISEMYQSPSVGLVDQLQDARTDPTGPMLEAHRAPEPLLLDVTLRSKRANQTFSIRERDGNLSVAVLDSGGLATRRNPTLFPLTSPEITVISATDQEMLMQREMDLLRSISEDDRVYLQIMGILAERRREVINEQQHRAKSP